MKIDVVYIVSHGFASRMVLQTGLLEKLQRKGLKVALISPDKEDKNLINNCKQQDVTLLEFKASRTLWNDEFLELRKYFLEDIKNNPALWAKHQRSLYENKKRHPIKKLLPYIYKFINSLAIAFPFIKNGFKSSEKRFLNNLSAANFLKKIDPKLIIATYPVNLTESTLLHEARKQNIKTCIHLLSWDNITAKGQFSALADKYIAWGPIMKQEFKDYYGVKDKDISMCGVPHFDEHFRSKTNPNFKMELENLGLHPEGPYLFFGMSSPYFAPREIDIVEWLAKSIEQNKFGDQLQLVVRPHPQNIKSSMADQSWLPRLDALTSSRVSIDYPKVDHDNLPWSMDRNDMSRMSNLLGGSQICLNSCSTMSIDSLMVGRPVILTAFDAEEKLPWWQSTRRVMDYIHYAKFIETGGARVVKNFMALEKEINNFLATENLDIENRNKAVDLECFKNDGCATERVVDTILRLAKADNNMIDASNPS